MEETIIFALILSCVLLIILYFIIAAAVRKSTFELKNTTKVLLELKLVELKKKAILTDEDYRIIVNKIKIEEVEQKFKKGLIAEPEYLNQLDKLNKY